MVTVSHRTFSGQFSHLSGHLSDQIDTSNHVVYRHSVAWDRSTVRLGKCPNIFSGLLWALAGCGNFKREIPCCIFDIISHSEAKCVLSNRLAVFTSVRVDLLLNTSGDCTLNWYWYKACRYAVACRTYMLSCTRSGYLVPYVVFPLHLLIPARPVLLSQQLLSAQTGSWTCHLADLVASLCKSGKAVSKNVIEPHHSP
jgi:hypothetical protein